MFFIFEHFKIILRYVYLATAGTLTYHRLCSAAIIEGIIVGIDNSKNNNDLNYLLPPNNIDLDSLSNNIDHIHRLVKLEMISYNELFYYINTSCY